MLAVLRVATSVIHDLDHALLVFFGGDTTAEIEFARSDKLDQNSC